MAKSVLLSYFFCQATDSRINYATAVLRGLTYLLVDRQPSLISHVRTKYDQAGKTLFEDTNAWVALSEIFTNILRDPSLDSTYLIIDALDECIVDLPKLVDFIVHTSSISPRVKWIVSSRNWPSIEEQFNKATQGVRLCLELNPKSISEAVGIYIQYKVDELTKAKKYSENLRDTVHGHLLSNAHDTFLWVALVCQELVKVKRWETRETLNEIPAGLDDLYKRMIRQIRGSKSAEIYKRILAVVSIVYQPITLDELASLIEMLDSEDYESLPEIIRRCGSFLILREHTISFVHQSAKDFLVNKASDDIFPSGKERIHHTILSQSLQVMSSTLQRDIYSLRAPGFSIDQVKQPDPDPLTTTRYSCLYWVDHLLDCTRENTINNCKDGGLVDKFLREDYLYWLEALSLMRSLSSGIVMIRKLENWLQVSFLIQFDYITRKLY
jgi:hypothetical protein